MSSAAAAPRAEAADPPASPAPARPRMGLRVLVLALGAFALVAGLYGGLARMGWALPGGTGALAALHGPLLVCGVFGTLIGLERAVALGRDWAYLASALAGGGTLALLAGAPLGVVAAGYALAAAALAATSLAIARQQPALFTGALLAGALTWLVGNLLWLRGGPVPDVVGWWLAFLVLTIAAERLELSRLLEPKRGSEATFLIAVALLLAGAQNTVVAPDGATLSGIALLVLAAWLLRHDIARRSIRRVGQPRFMAAAMLAGYGWLAVGGAVLLLPPGAAALGYDAALHAVFIGFVFSMVFGHALIILPALTRVRIRYSPAMAVPLALLHGAVALRVGGSLAGWDALRAWSGPATVLALVCFAGTVVAGASATRGPLSPARSPAGPP